jgi:RNA polymerase sigma-70 factor (ECF subfamily)
MTNTNDAVLNDLISSEWPKLRRFFRTKVPDADVLDLAQSTLLAFVEGRARATSSQRAYLWGIARFQVLKHYDRHRSAVAFDSALHTALDLGPSLSSRLDGHNRLLQALHTLPVDHQMAFELRHGEELSLDDVADALGVSLATAKRYLVAAQVKLKAALDADEDTLGRAYAAL